MRADVVAIGTELLLGQIIDTNSSWIGEQLALAGIDTHFQTKVGDNVARIVEAIEAALAHSEAVICCGGLGPTQDDLTRQAIAQVMGVDLVFDADKADLIRHMFGSRGRDMPDKQPAAGVPARGFDIHRATARHGSRPRLPDLPTGRRRHRCRQGRVRGARRAVGDEGDGDGHRHPRPP